MAKYIVDLDAFKECLDLLENPVRYGDRYTVYLDDVKELIKKFPKDEYGKEYAEKLYAYRNASINRNEVNQ